MLLFYISWEHFNVLSLVFLYFCTFFQIPHSPTSSAAIFLSSLASIVPVPDMQDFLDSEFTILCLHLLLLTFKLPWERSCRTLSLVLPNHPFVWNRSQACIVIAKNTFSHSVIISIKFVRQMLRPCIFVMRSDLIIHREKYHS